MNSGDRMIFVKGTKKNSVPYLHGKIQSVSRVDNLPKIKQ